MIRTDAAKSIPHRIVSSRHTLVGHFGGHDLLSQTVSLRAEYELKYDAVSDQLHRRTVVGEHHI